jgi:hypothetical protein
MKFREYSRHPYEMLSTILHHLKYRMKIGDIRNSWDGRGDLVRLEKRSTS